MERVNDRLKVFWGLDDGNVEVSRVSLFRGVDHTLRLKREQLASSEGEALARWVAKIQADSEMSWVLT